MTLLRLPIFFLTLLAAGGAFAQYGPSGAPAPGPLRIIGGGSNGGCIQGAVPLPASTEGLQTIHSGFSHFYGAPGTIQGLLQLGQEARANGLPPLLVEDISLPRGGPMPGGHAAHQIGLDADVALDMRSRGFLSPALAESITIQSLVRADGRDVEPGMWNEGVVRLLWLAATLPNIDRVLVNPAIKLHLCQTVSSDRSWLRFIRPYWGHAAHMHVAFKCPPGQPECVPKAPPPPGDGCDQLGWWFEPHPPGPAHPPGPKPRLPEACYALFGWNR